MKHEFQVLYQFTENTGLINERPTGPVQTVTVIAGSDDLVRAQFTQAGFAVVAVNEIRPVVDWSKPTFDLDEAGAYCGIKGVTFCRNKGDGKTPWINLGRGFITRELLEAWILAHANEPAKKILNPNS